MIEKITQQTKPQVAIDAINNHDHSGGGLGNQIPTDGLADKAVTLSKMADKSVDGDKLVPLSIKKEHIENGTLTADKFEPGILNSTTDSSTLGYKNYLCTGMDVNAVGGLNVNVEAGRYNMNDVFGNSALATKLMDAVKTSLLYYKKDAGVDGVVGKVDAVLPVKDSDTIFLYDFSQADMTNKKVFDIGGYVSDGSQDLIFAGTTPANIAKKPGWNGYGLVNDSASFIRMNAGAFKYDFSATGQNKFHIIVGFLYRETGAVFCPLNMQDASANYQFQFVVQADQTAGFYFRAVTTALIPLNYVLQKDKMYVMDLSYDGDTLRAGINGRIMYKAQYQNRIPGKVTTLWFGADNTPTPTGISRSVLQFAWGRKSVLGEEDICRMCAKLLLPVDFSDYNSEPPALSETGEFHVWAMDEASGNIVADTGGNAILANGTASNCDIIDGKYGMGKARRFRQLDTAHYSQILLGNFSVPSTVAFFFAIEANVRGKLGVLFDNRAGSTSGMTVRINSDNTLCAINTKTYAVKTSISKIEFEKLIVVGFVFADGGVYIYNDSEIPEFLPGIIVDNTANPATIGFSPSYPAEGFVGDMYHAFMLTRVPTTEEIKYYFSKMKKQIDVKTADVVLPSNALPLSLVRTNESAVVAIDKKPRYRSQNPFSGKKKYWCGWQWGTLSKVLYWDNPFMTQKVKCTFYYKRNLWDDRVAQIWNIYSGGLYGVQTKDIDCETIKAVCGNQQLCLGASTFGIDSSYFPAANYDQTVGWIGLLVEVIEDAVVQQQDW